MGSPAIFAAGCFWGVQYYFDQVPGVLGTTVGYIGGSVDNPTYDMVCSHNTGHAEAVRIDFDTTSVTYETLLQHFFKMHNPTQLNRQGPDVGDNYRSAIFYVDIDQKNIAKRVLQKLNDDEFNGKLVTSLEAAATFWPAEDYHQKYAERTGRGMCHIPYEPLG